MSVNQIKSQLLASLNAMGSLKAAYPFETGNPLGNYPFATLTFKGGDGKYADTARNLRRQSFWIRVYQEQSKLGQGVQAAESIAINVLDEFTTHLDAITTLSGTCKYARPVTYNTNYVDRELDTRILEIQVDVFEIVPANR